MNKNKRIRSGYWKDELIRLHDEGKTAKDQMLEVIDRFNELGGEYAEYVPYLEEIDKALTNGQKFIKTGRKKVNTVDEILSIYCEILTNKIDKIYKNAEKETLTSPDGSSRINTKLTDDEKKTIHEWAWAYWELHYVWNRLVAYDEEYDTLSDIYKRFIG